MLIETRCDAAWWQEELTTKWRADPARAAEKIRFRPSSQLAQKTTTFAKISATPDQIAAARVRAQHDTPGLTTWRVTLRIELGTTGQSDIWLPDCLEEIARRSGLTLRQALHDRATDIHEWRPILNYEGAWTGGVTIQLASEGEVRTLHHAAHGQGIQVQQCSAIVEITSAYVVLDAYDGRDSSPFYHPGGPPTVPMPLRRLDNSYEAGTTVQHNVTPRHPTTLILPLLSTPHPPPPTLQPTLQTIWYFRNWLLQ